jgi:hypothetical protein
MRTKIAPFLVMAPLLVAGVFVAAQKPPKPPPRPHMCQALSDKYVNPTTSEDLVVSLPPTAVHSDFTVWAREDDPTTLWQPCPKDGVNLCPIGVSGFQNCKVQGGDPRDGAEKFGCVFRNDGRKARRARLVVVYKEVPICCKP